MLCTIITSQVLRNGIKSGYVAVKTSHVLRGEDILKQLNVNSVHLPTFSCPAFEEALELWLPYDLPDF